MNQHPLTELAAHGQSPWLDYLDRAFLANGELARLVREGCARGLTSNPAIFEKAFAGGAYAAPAAALAGKPVTHIAETLIIEDIRAAADLFADLHRATGGGDGHVSLEVDPTLADDAAGTVEAGRRLWQAVDRPNLMIKVPGTPAGFEAGAALIGHGINVNFTLLFSAAGCVRVAEAYMQGLETRLANGASVGGLASVASYFVSRLDTAVDARIEALDAGRRATVDGLRGRAAIAASRQVHAAYRAAHAGARWQRLVGAGARAQRLLWASTGTKNPAYRDVLYVEELVGDDTVTTLPLATMNAFRDHGRVRNALAEPGDEAQVLAALKAVGIDHETIGAELQAAGLRDFVSAYQRMLAGLEGPARAA